MKNRIVLKATKLKNDRKLVKILKLILLFLILLLLILYVVVGIIYNSGNFSVTLDKNLYFERGIIIYDDPDYKIYRSELLAKTIDGFDNISYKWLPNNLTETNGSHNGNNYVAYTFYVENTGDKVTNFWNEMVIDDVIKNVDGAIRIRVYKENNYVDYAKTRNGQAEPNTTAFESNNLVTHEFVENFKPGDRIKYTVVLWLEGSDPDCNDNILGGEIKIHMEFNSEFVEK